MAESLERIPVPAGSATFYRPEEPAPGDTRELELIGAENLQLLMRLVSAREIRIDGVLAHKDPTADGPAVDVTAADLAGVRELNDAAVLVFLRSWTLDRPLPTSIAELHALPPALYAALSAHAGKLAARRGEGFAALVTER